jgi:anthranilate phosphoribosyltransferase
VTDAALWPEVIGTLVRGDDLRRDLVERVVSTILAGEATDAQIAGFSVALRAKGETPEELVTFARTMMRFANRVDLSTVEGPVIDTCGTGGDRSGSVNVSTMAALVAAGAGAGVAKHGGRSASSQCGSADVLEALGVVIDLGPDGVARCVKEAGIGFCFAPKFHPALRFAAPARRELGTPTSFNFVAPLCNPAGVRRHTLGVADPAMASRHLDALTQLGAEHAMVFYGHDGWDELSVTTTSTVHEVRGGEVHVYDVEPADLGLAPVHPTTLVGGDAAVNAAVVREVLSGAAGGAREIVTLNAAAALVVADLAPDLAAGCDLARAVLDDGRAAAALDALVAVSHDARTLAAPA